MQKFVRIEFLYEPSDLIQSAHNTEASAKDAIHIFYYAWFSRWKYEV